MGSVILYTGAVVLVGAVITLLLLVVQGVNSPPPPAPTVVREGTVGRPHQKASLNAAYLSIEVSKRLLSEDSKLGAAIADCLKNGHTEILIEYDQSKIRATTTTDIRDSVSVPASGYAYGVSGAIDCLRELERRRKVRHADFEQAVQWPM